MRLAKLIVVVLWLAGNAWLIDYCVREHIEFELLSAKSDWVGTGPMNHDENCLMALCLAIEGLLAMAATAVVAKRRSLDIVTGAFRGIGAALISPVLMFLFAAATLTISVSSRALPESPLVFALFGVIGLAIIIAGPIAIAVSVVLPRRSHR